jgi:Mrp family chromosome partitioning ATPase
MSIVMSAFERSRSDRAPQAEERPAPRSKAFDPAGLAGTSSRSPLPRWSTQPPIDLDIERLRGRGLFPPARFVPCLQEEYRTIRREIIAASCERVGPDDEAVGPIVVLTSALPGEGKSYTALNLALSIASEDLHDVLLIDADTVKRTISAACGLEGRSGLMELLANPGSGLAEHVHPTTAARLFVLPAGTRTRASADLFCAGRVVPLFASIRAAMMGHFVIVDSPPILLSSDTSILADVAGQVLVVVRAGRSFQDTVKEAVSRIRESIPVGVVLNGWSPMLASERRTYAALSEYTKS